MFFGFIRMTPNSQRESTLPKDKSCLKSLEGSISPVHRTFSKCVSAGACAKAGRRTKGPNSWRLGW